MRPFSALTLALAAALLVAPAAANAAAAKPPPKARTATKRHAYCPPHQKLTNMYVFGTRLCVDPRPVRYHLDVDGNVVYD